MGAVSQTSAKIDGLSRLPKVDRVAARGKRSRVFAMPGERNVGGLEKVSGLVRRGIVHALTYNGFPLASGESLMPDQPGNPLLDRCLRDLPEETAFSALTTLQRQYLSFSVYTLKQMVAAQTISPATAWSLYYWETGRNLEKLQEIDDGNFAGRRQQFYQEMFSRKMAEPDFAAAVEELGLPQILREESDVALAFEFWARKGQVNADEVERYRAWQKIHIFDESQGKSLIAAVKEEYRRALWVEMRLFEQRVGICAMEGLNRDIDRFTLDGFGGYSRGGQFGYRRLVGSIDLFNATYCKAGEPLDSTFKSEIGHWLLGILAPTYNPASEFMDRINFSSFSDAVLAAFEEEVDPETLPPAASVFLIGAYLHRARCVLLGDLEAGFPTHPDNFPDNIPAHLTEREAGNLEHLQAEQAEILARQAICREFCAGRLSREKVLETYYHLPVYVGLLNLEGKTWEEILERINVLDQPEISRYHANWEEIAFAAVEGRLLSPAGYTGYAEELFLPWLDDLGGERVVRPICALLERAAGVADFDFMEQVLRVLWRHGQGNALAQAAFAAVLQDYNPRIVARARRVFTELGAQG